MYLTRKKKLFGLFFVLTLVLIISSFHISIGNRISFAENVQKNIAFSIDKSTNKIFEVGKIDIKAKSDDAEHYFKLRIKNDNSKIIDSNELNLSSQLKKLDVVDKKYDSNNNLTELIFKLKNNESIDFQLFTTSLNGMPGEISVEGFDSATLNDIRLKDNYSDKVSLNWKNENAYIEKTSKSVISPLENHSDVGSDYKDADISTGNSIIKNNYLSNVIDKKLDDNNISTSDDRKIIQEVASNDKQDFRGYEENNSEKSVPSGDSNAKYYNIGGVDGKTEKNKTYSDGKDAHYSNIDVENKGADKDKIVENNVADEDKSDKKIENKTLGEGKSNNDVENKTLGESKSDNDIENKDNNTKDLKENKEAVLEDKKQNPEDINKDLEQKDDNLNKFSKEDSEKSFFDDYMRFSSSSSDELSLDVINSFVGLDRSSIDFTPKKRTRRSVLRTQYYNYENSDEKDPIPKHVKSIEKNTKDPYDDTYKLSLDSEGFFKKKGVDILFIVDTSNSMTDNFYNDEVAKNPKDSRWGKLYNIVTSEDGLSDTFLDNDSIDARVGVEFFNGNVEDYETEKSFFSETLTKKGSDVTFTFSVPSEVRVIDSPYNDAKMALYFNKWNKNSFNNYLKIKGEEDIKYRNGTNSQAALHFAVNNMLPKMRDDAHKYIIFLTDGKPDFYYSYPGESARFPIPNPVPKHLRAHFADKSNRPDVKNDFLYVDSTPSPGGYSLGGGQFVNKTSVERALMEARNIKGIDGFFAVGLSKDAIGSIDSNASSYSRTSNSFRSISGESIQNNSSDGDSDRRLYFDNDFYRSSISNDQSNLTNDFMKGLINVVRRENPKATVSLYETLDSNELNIAMKNIVNKIYSGIGISDTLSQYVDYVPVTKYRQRGYLSFTKNGVDNWKNMYYKYGPDFYKFTYDSTGKKISLKISNKVGLASDEKVEINFYVKPNENAYHTFGDNLNRRYNGQNVELYPDISSDGVRGFYSNKNDDVTLSYNDDERQTVPYLEKPVVHISTKSITVEKKWLDNAGNEISPKDIDIPIQVELRAYPKDSEDSSFGYYNNESGQYLSFKKTLDKSNGYKFTFNDLPAKYYDYRVVELTKLNNFETKYSINRYEDKATIYNKSTIELPKTGGFGTLILSIVGTLMITTSFILLKKYDLIGR